jgi:hypothetical protein
MADGERRVGSGALFPTDEPVSGDALIVAAGDVDGIAITLLGAIDVVLAGPRRLGKTSVARAALEVCRAADVYTVAVDLFRQPDALALAQSPPWLRSGTDPRCDSCSPGRARRPPERGRSPR